MVSHAALFATRFLSLVNVRAIQHAWMNLEGIVFGGQHFALYRFYYYMYYYDYGTNTNIPASPSMNEMNELAFSGY